MFCFCITVISNVNSFAFWLACHSSISKLFSLCVILSDQVLAGRHCLCESNHTQVLTSLEWLIWKWSITWLGLAWIELNGCKTCFSGTFNSIQKFQKASVWDSITHRAVNSKEILDCKVLRIWKLEIIIWTCESSTWLDLNECNTIW